MRIMLVTPLFRPGIGGASVYFDILSKQLADKKEIKRIIILTRYLKSEVVFKKEKKVWILRCLANLNVNSYLMKYIESITTPLIILFFSMLFRVSLIHYHSLACYKGIYLLSFLFKIPLICDMRDLAAKNEKASLFFYSHTSRIICCSENICRFVESHSLLKNNIAYIPIPFEPPAMQTKPEIDSIKRKFGISNDMKYICFAGAIIEYKGIFELIEAFKILSERGYKWYLIIVGPMEFKKSSNEYKKFEAEIKHPEIKYIGPLKRKEALGFIQDCDVFILPSKSESISRVCLEAISLGAKAILPGCVPEYKRHCADFVLDKIDPTEIAEKIIEVSKLDKRPTYPLSIHDCSKIVDQTYSLYMEILLPNRKRGQIG